MSPEFYFSQHLKRRMAQRKVTIAQVELTLQHPDVVVNTTAPDTGEPSIRHSRTLYDGRTLKVWIVPPVPGSPWVVKSTAWKGVNDDE